MKGSVGARIKRLRERRDWSQIDLEQKTGINNSVLSRIEANKRPVQADELDIFASVFNVSADYLLGRTENPTKSYSEEAEVFFDLIELSEEEAIEKIKKSFSYKGRDVNDDQARKIYYFSLGIVNQD